MSIAELQMKFGKYLLVGVINTCITVVLIFVMLEFVGAHYLFANLVGYGVGFINSFVMNRSFTFRSEGLFWRQAVGFGIAFALSYVASQVVVFGLVESGVTGEHIAVLVGMVIYTVTSFHLNARYVFRHRKSSERSSS